MRSYGISGKQLIEPSKIPRAHNDQKFCLAHFCDNHGPTTILCTQAQPDRCSTCDTVAHHMRKGSEVGTPQAQASSVKGKENEKINIASPLNPSKPTDDARALNKSTTRRPRVDESFDFAEVHDSHTATTSPSEPPKEAGKRAPTLLSGKAYLAKLNEALKLVDEQDLLPPDSPLENIVDNMASEPVRKEQRASTAEEKEHRETTAYDNEKTSPKELIPDSQRQPGQDNGTVPAQRFQSQSCGTSFNNLSSGKEREEVDASRSFPEIKPTRGSGRRRNKDALVSDHVRRSSFDDGECTNCAMTLPNSLADSFGSLPRSPPPSGPSSGASTPTYRSRVPFKVFEDPESGYCSAEERTPDKTPDASPSKSLENRPGSFLPNRSTLVPPASYASTQSTTSTRSSTKGVGFTPTFGIPKSLASHEHMLTYTSTHRPLSKEVFSLLRNAVVRTLSGEQLPKGLTSGRLFFGSKADGYCIAFTFRLPDRFARGGKRGYALIALAGKDSPLLSHVVSKIWMRFEMIAEWLTQKVEFEASLSDPAPAPGLASASYTYLPSPNVVEFLPERPKPPALKSTAGHERAKSVGAGAGVGGGVHASGGGEEADEEDKPLEMPPLARSVTPTPQHPSSAITTAQSRSPARFTTPRSSSSLLTAQPQRTSAFQSQRTPQHLPLTGGSAPTFDRGLGGVGLGLGGSGSGQPSGGLSSRGAFGAGRSAGGGFDVRTAVPELRGRGLPEMTGDEQVFAKVHARFVGCSAEVGVGA